jgi:hypothetical protein
VEVSRETQLTSERTIPLTVYVICTLCDNPYELRFNYNKSFSRRADYAVVHTPRPAHPFLAPSPQST